MNTACAAAAFMLMFNIIEKKSETKMRWWMKELYRQRIIYGDRLMRYMTFELVEDTVKKRILGAGIAQSV
jgi:hypothetical protein